MVTFSFSSCCLLPLLYSLTSLFSLSNRQCLFLPHLFPSSKTPLFILSSLAICNSTLSSSLFPLFFSPNLSLFVFLRTSLPHSPFFSISGSLYAPINYIATQFAALHASYKSCTAVCKSIPGTSTFFIRLPFFCHELLEAFHLIQGSCVGLHVHQYGDPDSC